MTKENLNIKGMDCAECALTLERGLGRLEGVQQAQVSFTMGQMTLDFDPGEISRETIEKRVRELGYEVAEEPRPAGEETAKHPGLWETIRQRRQEILVAAAGLLMGLAFGLHLAGTPDAVSHALYATATVVAGSMAARAGWVALRTAHTLDMNVLMTLAAAGALVIGEFEEAAVVTFLFAFGNLLENYTLDRARGAIRGLMELTPPRATRLPPRPTPLSGAGEEKVDVEALAVGDRILVRPGERIPMDGQVLEGRSAVNQAPITGESLPVEKAPGDEVFAGTVNGSGVLIVEVTRLASDNTIARVIQMVEEAQAQKAPSQRFIDRFARVYTPVVVGGALLVAVVPPLAGLGNFLDWFYRALVLLVISCPCALVISTPVTIVSGIARAARAGVLIKGGMYLEQAGSLRVMAFDKTGTLTQGRPVVVAGRCADHSHDEALQPGECADCLDLLGKACAIETRSEHPLAQAIIEHARDFGVGEIYAPAQAVEAVAGRGVRGRVAEHDVTVGSHAYVHGDRPIESFCDAVEAAEAKGQTLVVIEDECCDRRSYLTVADRLREDVPRVVAELHRAGIQHTIMLTGDNEAIAQSVASTAGIDEFRANLLPEQKMEAVEQLLTRYESVAMVGDGINDAPALARASLGIVMGAAGSDAALETADIALMGDDLTRLPFTIRLSRRVLSIIRQNVGFSLLVKAVFLVLAVAGVATLWMAVFADMGASLLVTLNGMRALGYRGQE